MNKWIAALSFLLLFQNAGAQLPSKKSIASVDRFLKSTYGDTLPGVAVAIVENNATVFEKGYGVANIQTQQKITAFTTFNIASLTKQFTAMAILQLAEKGKLSLTDKLSVFLPEMNKNIADQITIRQLLTHTSGIRDHYEYTDTAGLKHAHNKDVYNAIKNVDSLYFTPGSQFRYSNTGYCLLALIIEKISGMSYNAYMQKHIFAPAGMKHTSIWSEGNKIVTPATGYDKDSITNRFMTSGADEHIFFSTEGDGGIYTSVTDYLQWFNALQQTKVFSKSIVEQARSIQYAIDSKRRLGYGFGWFVDESENDKHVYHSGSNGGYRTFSFTIPDKGFAIVVFSNRSDLDIEEMALHIYNILFPDEKPFTKIEALTS